MTPALRSLRSVLRAYWRDESGATAIIMVLATSLALIAVAAAGSDNRVAVNKDSSVSAPAAIS